MIRENLGFLSGFAAFISGSILISGGVTGVVVGGLLMIFGSIGMAVDMAEW